MTNFGIFWRALEWEILVNFMAIWNIRQPFDIPHGHLEHFVAILYIFFRFGMLYKEKSGNPARIMHC
jgi:hypothetical protein